MCQCCALSRTTRLVTAPTARTPSRRRHTVRMMIRYARRYIGSTPNTGTCTRVQSQPTRFAESSASARHEPAPSPATSANAASPVQCWQQGMTIGTVLGSCVLNVSMPVARAGTRLLSSGQVGNHAFLATDQSSLADFEQDGADVDAVVRCHSCGVAELPHQPEHTALRGLLAAVAPGGTFLIASHDLADLSSNSEHGVDPSHYYQPAEIAELLDDTWTILVSETRPRATPTPSGTGHTHDTVLRAQRVR